MVRSFVHDPAYLRRGFMRIDYWGIGLLAVGIGALQISLDKGQEEDWFSSNFITILIVVAAIALLLFVLHELVVRDPVVNLRAFRERSFAAGTLLVTLMSVGLFGSLVLLPVLLQTLMGYSPLAAGWAMMPRGLGSLISTPIVGVILARTDPRKILATGRHPLRRDDALAVVAQPQCRLLEPGLAAVHPGDCLRDDLRAAGDDVDGRHPACGDGQRHEPVQPDAKHRRQHRHRRVQTMLARDRQIHTAVLGAHVEPFGAQTQIAFANLRSVFIARGSDFVTATQRAYAALFGMVQKQAAITAFLDAFRAIAVVFVAMVPFVFLLRRPRHQSRGAVAAE